MKEKTKTTEVFTLQKLVRGEWREVKEKGKVVELHNQKALRNYIRNKLAVDDSYLVFRNGVAFTLGLEAQTEDA
jgi:hypothetical protein